MTAVSRAAWTAALTAATVVACGARTGLLVPEPGGDAGKDAAASCTGTEIPLDTNTPNLYFVLDASERRSRRVAAGRDGPEGQRRRRRRRGGARAEPAGAVGGHVDVRDGHPRQRALRGRSRPAGHRGGRRAIERAVLLPRRHRRHERAGGVPRPIAAQATSSCSFTLTRLPVDPNEVNVYVGGALVPRDGPDGWSIQGTKLTLEGATCDCNPDRKGPLGARHRGLPDGDAVVGRAPASTDGVVPSRASSDSFRSRSFAARRLATSLSVCSFTRSFQKVSRICAATWSTVRLFGGDCARGARRRRNARPRRTGAGTICPSRTPCAALTSAGSTLEPRLVRRPVGRDEAEVARAQVARLVDAVLARELAELLGRRLLLRLVEDALRLLLRLAEDAPDLVALRRVVPRRGSRRSTSARPPSGWPTRGRGARGWRARRPATARARPRRTVGSWLVELLVLARRATRAPRG